MNTVKEVAEYIGSLSCKPDHPFNSLILYAKEHDGKVNIFLYRTPSDAEKKSILDLTGDHPVEFEDLEQIEKETLARLERELGECGLGSD
jgi:hypothetical protein